MTTKLCTGVDTAVNRGHRRIISVYVSKLCPNWTLVCTVQFKMRTTNALKTACGQNNTLTKLQVKSEPELTASVLEKKDPKHTRD